MTRLTPAQQRVRQQRRMVMERLGEGTATFEDLYQFVGCTKARLRAVIASLIESELICNRETPDGARVYETWETALARVRALNTHRPARRRADWKSNVHTGSRVG